MTQPYFPLIASKNLTEAQVATVRKNVLALGESDAGQAVLKTVGVERSMAVAKSACASC